MDIRQIEYFRAVCETLNYTRAADILHISQPSLSAAIQKLEGELGVKLLIRDNKKVLLTREGSVLLRESETLIQQANHIKEVMNDLRVEEERTLKLAFPSTVGAWLWPVLLEDFRREHPEIELVIEDMSTFDILRGIQSDELEIGYGVIDVNHSPDIVSRTLVRDELKLLLSVDDELAKSERVDVHSLEGRTAAMYRKGTSFSESLFLRVLAENSVRVNLRYVTEQATVFSLVAMGLAFAVVLDETELIRRNPLLCVREFSGSVHYEAGLFWKKDRYLSSSAKKLIAFLCR